MTHLQLAIEVDRLHAGNRCADAALADETFRDGRRCQWCQFRLVEGNGITEERVRSCTAPSPAYCIAVQEVER